MRRSMIMAACAASVVTAIAAPRMSQNHVPEKLDEVRPFFASAAERPHIALVNVGGAISDADWALSATYAVSRLQLNVWTNALPKISAEQLVRSPDMTEKLLLNPNAKVGVFLENRKGGCPIVAAPGHWSVVNVACAYEGAPSVQVRRDRLAKLVLKGIAAASGGGATVEPFCSMFYGSTTLAGLDGTNIMLAPMCYFPMLEILRSVGGPEMTRPSTAEQ